MLKKPTAETQNTPEQHIQSNFPNSLELIYNYQHKKCIILQKKTFSGYMETISIFFWDLRAFSFLAYSQRLESLESKIFIVFLKGVTS